MDKQKLEKFIEHVKEAATNPNFKHHSWFIEWHVILVERIALELASYYEGIENDYIRLLAWLHDYGKIIDAHNEQEMTQVAGRRKLLELGFNEDVVARAIKDAELIDSWTTIDMHTASIEAQILSSADGCSHMVGPFMALWLYENPSKPYDVLMQGNVNKLTQGWNRKVVLPEARQFFKQRFMYALEANGVLPQNFIGDK